MNPCASRRLLRLQHNGDSDSPTIDEVEQPFWPIGRPSGLDALFAHVCKTSQFKGPTAFNRVTKPQRRRSGRQI